MDLILSVENVVNCDASEILLLDQSTLVFQGIKHASLPIPRPFLIDERFQRISHSFTIWYSFSLQMRGVQLYFIQYRHFLVYAFIWILQNESLVVLQCLLIIFPPIGKSIHALCLTSHLKCFENIFSHSSMQMLSGNSRISPKCNENNFDFFFIHTRTRRAQAALAIGLCLCSERKLAADFDDSILVFWTFSNMLRYFFFICLRVFLSPCLFVVPTVSLMICLCDYHQNCKINEYNILNEYKYLYTRILLCTGQQILLL